MKALLVKVLILILIYSLASNFYNFIQRSSGFSKMTNYTVRFPRVKNSLWNVTNFTYIFNPIQTCSLSSNDTSKILIMIIHSGRQYYHNRQVIRNTYGSLKTYMGYSIRIVFLLGEHDPSRNVTLFAKHLEDVMVTNENRQYGDIVKGNFVDTYKNLTYKAIMGLKWVTSYCSRASWVVKADDDIFVDLYKLIETREHDLATGMPPPNFYCIVVKPMKPNRVGGKWKITYEEYPDEYIPTFCYGATYAVDIQVVQRWLSVYNKVNFFWVDDVFVTGLVMREAKKVYNGSFCFITTNLRRNYSITAGYYKKYCDKLVWDGTREFKEIVVVTRAKAKRDMNCLWKIVNLERANVTLRKNSTISIAEMKFF